LTLVGRLEPLRQPIEARLRDLHSWLGGSVEQGRHALAELLDGERLQVGPEPGRAFRVVGMLYLAVDAMRLSHPREWGRVGLLGGSGGWI
jgi:hypothetical protein